MKKGQASTEYLIILAVVIIVALIVVGVMGWFPGISGAVTETESLQYWRGMTTPFTIQDYRYSGTSLELSLKNMGTDELGLDANGVSVDGSAGTNAAVNFSSGQTVAVTVTTTSCGTAGDQFTVDLAFTYDNQDSGISNNVQTGIKPLVGTCS